MQLAGFDPAAFLAEHWQKQPLLIRGAFSDWSEPLDPDDLAGLACEEGVEARLVWRKGKRWTLEHGPLEAERFATLGEKDWTLLVQAVDHWVPEVAALIEPFRFVPDWRIDDVMVSYAAEGGGVGPHFDRYDVFLVQGQGRRRWRIGPVCDAHTPLLPHDDLKLLAAFEPTDEWVLEPGDVLYVPPGFPHDGVAVDGACMTYSIGFRAPSRAELVSNWADYVLAELDEDDRYADPDLALQPNPGEIAAAALDRLHAMMAEALNDREAFARWFGRHATTPKVPEAMEPPAGARLLMHDVLARGPASRLAFIRTEEGVTLFADGEAFDCRGVAAAFAEALCARGSVAAPSDEAARALARTLLAQGSLVVAP